MILFYDFEVFKHDWLVVFIFPSERREEVIVNDSNKLESFYRQHKDDIWVGFNSNHYDQWILKAILTDTDPYPVSAELVSKDEHKKQGWELVPRIYIPLNSYDIKTNTDRSLKYYESSMGNDIEESSVPFDIDRKLSPEEIEETIRYCRHDVEQTVELFMERYSDFEAQMGLIKMFELPLSDISKTKVQLSAKILGARKMYSWKEINDRQKHKIPIHDEFDIDIPPTLRIEKYKEVVEAFMNPVNHRYDLENRCQSSSNYVWSGKIAGIDHEFGWGGVHGAALNYIQDGYFVNMDVASLYPSLMIEYDLLSRSCQKEKFKEIVETRLKFKAEKNPLQKPLKIVINGTYGASKDMNNPLFDPRQANRVCVYGQLLLLDLIEHLEPYCDIIQSNTDGVLVKLHATNEDEADREYARIDDIAHEWEVRTHLNLEFDEYRKVIQKDVNNYIIVAPDGHTKTKGAFVKEVGNLDHDLAVVNRAVVEFFVNDIPVRDTILNCNVLKDFQLTKHLTNKYDGFFEGGYGKKASKLVPLRTVRVFASNNKDDGKIHKYKLKDGLTNSDVYEAYNSKKVVDDMFKKDCKVENTPPHAWLCTEDINGKECPRRLDKSWYIRLAENRVDEFREGHGEIIEI